ncbi:hypothetical protein [Delftia sp. GW456-R20]|jgi:hypothetical protein|uniref:hypothetical protein n=1 Tax=Delftia sp. GW456-R20 TaxID=1827145 RepID=UPI000AF7965A|nr:hypothetical protein [Delftia sp. GW456-R20]
MKKLWLAALTAFTLVACGGGGGNPGTGGGTGGGTETPAGTMTIQVITGASSSAQGVISITASESTARARATLLDAKGAAVANEIVTFSEDGGSLLKFSPESRTALTDSKGVAEVEISAATATSIGATRVKASATIATKEVSGGQNLAITSAPPTGDPQALVQAINFLDVVPSDKSIVIKGSGGNGRSETAILRFKVVDSSGSPIKDVVVDFMEATGGVQVNIAQARSNNDGIVTTSVSSKSAPTSVVVRATVNGRNVTSQSDLLTVTTGISTQRGFDLSASKFNLDLDLSGDTSTLRIGIVDSNGNPVSDGVPVVATVDFGRVGSSNRGGCQTVNGLCTVDYQVQNPRPADGQLINVAISTVLGTGQVISDSLFLRATSVGWLSLYQSGALVNKLTVSKLDATCNAIWTGELGTPKLFPAPAGTTIEAKSLDTNVTVSVFNGSPVLDRVSGRSGVAFQVTSKIGTPAGSTQVQFTFKSNNNVSTLTLPVDYPACATATTPTTPTTPTAP